MNNNVIIKDEEIIGYVADVIEYLKNVLIDVLNKGNYQELDSNICVLIRQLDGGFDNELVRIVCDYDGDYIVKELIEK